MPISDLVRLRNLCIDYGVGAFTIEQGGYHFALDLLDRRAGIGTRGGTVQEFWGARPVNQLGKRISLHEASLSAGYIPSLAPVERQYKNHFFHLGAQGEHA